MSTVGDFGVSTFVHGGRRLAGGAGDDRRDHVVIVLEVDERRGVPAWRHVRDGSLGGHRPRHRDRRREQREVRRGDHPGHRADGGVREYLLSTERGKQSGHGTTHDVTYRVSTKSLYSFKNLLQRRVEVIAKCDVPAKA